MPSQADSMANLREELAAMLAPPIPRPVPPVLDPAYQTWLRTFQAHVDRKTDIIRLLGGEYATA